jgi:hypothetical protein
MVERPPVAEARRSRGIEEFYQRFDLRLRTVGPLDSTSLPLKA